LVTERDVRPRLGLQARPAPVAGFLSVLVRPVPSPDGADAVDAEEGEGGRERFGDERVERVVRAGFQLGGARRRVAPRLVLRAPKATPAAQETSSENQRVRERERARGREREGEREREREREIFGSHASSFYATVDLKRANDVYRSRASESVPNASI
jgi:hypothetical protein